MSTRAIRPLANVAPAPLPPPQPTRITDATSIRVALEASGIEVGPDPQHDGEWAAVIQWSSGKRSMPEMLHLVAFGHKVMAYAQRGTLEAGRTVWLEEDRLQVETIVTYR